jgi:hypothetical protein
VCQNLKENSGAKQLMMIMMIKAQYTPLRVETGKYLLAFAKNIGLKPLLSDKMRKLLAGFLGLSKQRCALHARTQQLFVTVCHSSHLLAASIIEFTPYTDIRPRQPAPLLTSTTSVRVQTEANATTNTQMVVELRLSGS